MATLKIRALVLATTVALSAAVGCTSTPSRGGGAPVVAVEEPSRSPGIALASPNAVLLGAVDGDEAYRNDARMGSATAGGFVVESVERDWYQRDRVLFGRSYSDSRFTTRVRERSVPRRP